MKACQQYALKEFAENIILLDTGHYQADVALFPSGTSAKSAWDAECAL